MFNINIFLLDKTVLNNLPFNLKKLLNI